MGILSIATFALAGGTFAVLDIYDLLSGLSEDIAGLVIWGIVFCYLAVWVGGLLYLDRPKEGE